MQIPRVPGAATAMLARFPLDDGQLATFWLLDVFSEGWELLDRIIPSDLTDLQDSDLCLNEVNEAVQAAYSAQVTLRPSGFSRAAATWTLAPRADGTEPV
jgi:hypothetical protein